MLFLSLFMFVGAAGGDPYSVGNPLGWVFAIAICLTGFMFLVPGLIILFIVGRKASKAAIKYRTFCTNCQKWFAVTRMAKVPCPNCRTPLEWRMECEWCGNWFYSSDATNKACPECMVGR